MRSIAKRVEKLEGPNKGKISVWAEVPEDWRKEHHKAQVRAMALEQGIKEPFTLTIFPTRQPHEGVRFIYVGSTDVLIEDIRSAMDGGRRIYQR